MADKKEKATEKRVKQLVAVLALIGALTVGYNVYTTAVSFVGWASSLRFEIPTVVGK